MSKPPSQPTDDDSLNPKVASSCLDFLLIELVPLVQRVTDQLQAREQALIDEYRRSKIFNKSSNRNSVQSQKDGDVGTQSIVVDGDSRRGDTEGQDEDISILGFPEVKENAREAMLYRLDGLGYRVGQGLVER
jgi:trafficking protein particle complex subunit 6